MAKHVVAVVALWILFSLAALAVILTFVPFPVAASEEAVEVDFAFTVLTIFAVPVFSFVMATLVYSIFRFRVSGTPKEDGPPVRYRKGLIAAWFVLTTGLTIVVIIFPGITGLNALRASENKTPDLTVHAEARRFAWKITYLDQEVFSRRELVLPKDEHALFLVDSVDILHSFWIPAFRVKIDAVPGQTTRTAATPTMLGGFEDDANFRLQCAELCGIGHAGMSVPVRVVERAEFDAWIAEQSPVN